MSEQGQSRYRVEKRRADAELTLTTGTRVKGCFFLWTASQAGSGPERVGDLLNQQDEFFPFELEDGRTALYNRAHIVSVRLPAHAKEVELEADYVVATRRLVSMLLSNGERVNGVVAVQRPVGHDRLSDYARMAEAFRYVQTATETLIVNSAHLVELRETGD